MSRIAVIGAGAWGTGLAIVLGRKGVHDVRLWAREREVYESIAAKKVNELFLPGQPVPENLFVTGALSEALHDAAIIVSVMPSQHCRALFQQMAPHLKPEALIVSATKGLEETTLLRMTQVIAETLAAKGLTPHLGALSGPSFAIEVARGDPTAVAIASTDKSCSR